jgi:nitrate/TMAO reductase-like tetraheme cytochrome c subunit
MERKQAFEGTTDGTPVPELAESGSKRPRLAARLKALVIVVVALFVLLVAADLVTSSPELCGSCHEMAPRAESWRKSAHASVKCVNCHVAPHAWYELPKSVFLQSSLLLHDTGVHLSGDYEDPVDSPPAGTKPIPDANCLQCHDVNRKATSGYRILIDHPKHAKLNGSCVSCHIRTGHPIDSRGRALSLMGQCFTCHGTGADAKAPANCSLCHPSDYELKPASHKDAEWMERHGRVAESDAEQCDLCHEQSFCDDCHGLKMPHPTDWSKGQEGHAAIAEQNRAVCEKCHGGSADMCTMCHHESYDPMKGTWVKQHFAEVDRQGTEYCLKCHSPVYCVRCHVAWATSGEVTP